MPSLPWPFGRKSESQPPSEGKQKPVIAEVQNEVAKVQQEVANLPPETLLIGAFIAGAATSIGLLACYKRYFKRIPNSDWITPNILGRKRWIKGTVTSVGDADNFRLYHTPGIGWRWPLKFRRVPSKSKDLRSQTIHIRIAGVDAPEAAHFGKPSQPFAADALHWLKSHIEGKTIYCQLHRRDQYNRVVAVPLLPPRILPGTFFGRPLALEMLRAGWVQVYEQAGAEYGPSGKDEFLRIQAEAQAARRGIWKNGINFESPAEYKKRYARGGGEAEAEAVDAPAPEKPGVLRRVFGALTGSRQGK